MPRKSISFELDFMIKDILPKFTVKQFDDISFNIKPKNQGLDYNTTGMTGKIFIGVNNDMFMQTKNITVSNNNVNILLDRNMLQKNGRAYAEVELTDSNGTITSSSFIFNIDSKIGEGATIPGSIEGFVAKYERLISEFKSQVNSTISNCNSSVNFAIKQCNSNVDNKLNTVDSLVNAKISDLEKRFNRLTSSQQQSAEVIDARDGEISLKARLDRDIEKAKQVYVNVEGSHISTDSSIGYLKDVEILGNTVQDASNLADIRSVGDTVEGQELYEIPVLSRGKNLFDGEIELGGYDWNNGVKYTATDRIRCKNQFIPIKPNTKYVSNQSIAYVWYDNAKQFIKSDTSYTTNPIQSPKNSYYVNIVAYTTDLTINIALYESDLPVSVYEPYQEDKITILSPTPLEKVGDVADRIIEKDGVWGVEKNVIASVDENNSLINTKIDSEFIPLPHSQQVKLRTFANKTNISFLTEIEGTIKAQVPKSLGATVNTHATQIDGLSKETKYLRDYIIFQNRMQLASTYSADSVTFKVDYALCSEEVENYNEDLYNLILNNILVGKDNYDYDKMFTMILDYASWNQISWEQFDILVGLMDIQHNPPIEEIPTDDEIVEEIPNEIM